MSDLESVGSSDTTALLSRLLEQPDVSEAFVLETCNRFEAYVVSSDTAAGREALTDTISGLSAVDVEWLTHDEALYHLLSVATGLESMVLGEDEILGQLKTAWERARDADAVTDVLDVVIEKAVHVGKRARSETAINEGILTLARMAVELADKNRSLREARCVVVGAGDMGTAAAVALTDIEVAQLTILNRTPSRAVELVSSLDDQAVADDLSALPEAISSADVVITATHSPEPLIDGTCVATAGDTLILDLAQPRDVDPAVATVLGIDLFDLDDLNSRIDVAESRRERAAQEVTDLIDRELEQLEIQLKRRQADRAIAAMYQGATEIKQRELQTALDKVEANGEFSPSQRDVLADLADALVGQLMAAPTKSLREAAEEDDWETIQTALELFDPDFSTGAVSPSTDDADSTSLVSEDS